MARFSLHAVGTDRPGIVAAVAEAIAVNGWNLEDSAMTLLRGQFAIVLVLDAGPISEGRVIEAALEEVAQELDLFLAVRPVTISPDAFATDDSVTFSVVAADRPGIVARISRELADVGADISELVSRIRERSGKASYALRLVADLPRGTDTVAVEARLRGVAEEFGGDATIVVVPSIER